MIRAGLRRAWPLGLALVVSACGGPAAPPAPPKAATPAPAAKPATPAVADPKATVDAATTAAAALVPAAPKYDPAGRRDPFESLESRLGSDRASVTNAKLTGVIHSGGTALVLVETSDGIGYILKAGDTLADGRLVEIGPSAAVFSIAPKPGTTITRVVLKLASD